jgi:hypothetical protein
MDEVWSLFRKKEIAPIVFAVSAIVFVSSIIGCKQNYLTTYEQLSKVYGTDIGTTFTVLAQAIEFLVPILLVWGVMKSLKISKQITVFVVGTGAVAWLMDVVTAGAHFWATAAQAPIVLRMLCVIVGAFLFVTMEIWVLLSGVTVVASIVVLKTGELPNWLTQPSRPVETPHLSTATGELPEGWRIRKSSSVPGGKLIIPPQELDEPTQILRPGQSTPFVQ